MLKCFFFIVSLLTVLQPAFCQQVQVQSSAPRYPKPKILLVMLHLSTNKIEALRKRNMEEDIPSVVGADEETNNSIMTDFSKNFSFCPVYFFYDTCYDQVKNKQWDQVVFYDYESLQTKKKVMVSSFSDYYIADVGYRAPQEQISIDPEKSYSKVDPFEGDEGSAASRNYGVNLYDENFKQLQNKLGFTDISLRKKGPLFGSKKYEFEGAAKLDKRLHNRYDEAVNK